MGKYYLAYLFFLFPALVISFFFDNGTMTSFVLQWFFGFFMIIGFGVNTAYASYHYPRAVMSFILGYTGLNLLIITVFYSSQYGTPFYTFMRDYAGALSYVPLGIMVTALLDFDIQQEVYITLLIAVFMLLGYAFGLVRRHVRPDPYHPRIG